ncbi:hypothetical protein AL755_19735 [Arthrobacter sp. ERGS1:01]|uniref:hypothetical protein n=1 Tax=Arthrobacter sp. ERGS1:01 TaxID=1704044 RepID=UPI0006B44F15|nr:hypothetical protein [Arthrobacter sp. ERGS1:01]ALE07187.1 hypothetical protein AL755_19735 [Arthrobacter sp. ERGS1:01]
MTGKYHLPHRVVSALRWLFSAAVWACLGGLLVIGMLNAGLDVPPPILMVLAAAIYWLAATIYNRVVPRIGPARLVRGVQKRRPDDFVFGVAAATFLQMADLPPAGTALDHPPGRMRLGFAVSVDGQGMTCWARIPQPTPVFHLPWAEVGPGTVELHRIPRRGRRRGVEVPLICFPVHNSQGEGSPMFCVADNWRRPTSANCEQMAELLARMQSERAGWSDMQHFTV